MKFEKDRKLMKVYTDNTVKCKCGHSIFMPVFVPHKICNWCGHRVFRNKKEEFKYKLEHEIRKNGAFVKILK